MSDRGEVRHNARVTTRGRTPRQAKPAPELPTVLVGVRAFCVDVNISPMTGVTEGGWAEGSPASPPPV